MVEINLSSRGRFVANQFAIGTTSKNNYYPFYSQFTKVPIAENVFLYYKPEQERRGYSISRYSELFDYLHNRMHFSPFRFSSNDEDHYILVMKGYIANELGQPLFMLSVSNYENTAEGTPDWDYKPDYSKFKLFIATEFINNPIYSNIWRKLDKEYVQKCHKLGIAVEYNTMDNLENFFFSNEFELKYDNLTELHNHLKNDVSALLFEDLTYQVSDVDTDDNEEDRPSLVELCQSAAAPEHNRLVAEDLHAFAQGYYVNHGSSPSNIYVTTSGVVIFSFANTGIIHEFSEAQILAFLSNDGIVPIPESVDDIYEDYYLPHDLIEENGQQDVDYSVTNVIYNNDNQRYVVGIDSYSQEGTRGIVGQIQDEAVVYNSTTGISEADLRDTLESMSGSNDNIESISQEEQEAAQQDIAEAGESDGGFDLVDDTEDVSNDEERPF